MARYWPCGSVSSARSTATRSARSGCFQHAHLKRNTPRLSRNFAACWPPGASPRERGRRDIDIAPTPGLCPAGRKLSEQGAGSERLWPLRGKRHGRHVAAAENCPMRVVPWHDINFSHKFGASRRGDGIGAVANDLPLLAGKGTRLVVSGENLRGRKMYAEHRGQIVDEPDKRSWEQVVLKDFDDLEKAGITHSEITHMREMLQNRQARPQHTGQESRTQAPPLNKANDTPRKLGHTRQVHYPSLDTAAPSHLQCTCGNCLNAQKTGCTALVEAAALAAAAIGLLIRDVRPIGDSNPPLSRWLSTCLIPSAAPSPGRRMNRRNPTKPRMHWCCTSSDRLEEPAEGAMQPLRRPGRIDRHRAAAFPCSRPREAQSRTNDPARLCRRFQTPVGPPSAGAGPLHSHLGGVAATLNADEPRVVAGQPFRRSVELETLPRPRDAAQGQPSLQAALVIKTWSAALPGAAGVGKHRRGECTGGGKARWPRR